MLQYMKGKNPSFGSRDKMHKTFFRSTFENFTVIILWWPWKLGQGHQDLIKSLIHTNVTVYMNFGHLLQEMQASFFGQNLKISKCWYDLENEVNVTKT